MDTCSMDCTLNFNLSQIDFKFNNNHMISPKNIIIAKYTLHLPIVLEPLTLNVIP